MNRAAPHFVYTLWDETGAPLYVGCTNNIRERMRHHKKTMPWFGEVCYVSSIEAANRTEGLDLEWQVIEEVGPLHNSHKTTHLITHERRQVRQVVNPRYAELRRQLMTAPGEWVPVAEYGTANVASNSAWQKARSPLWSGFQIAQRGRLVMARYQPQT